MQMSTIFVLDLHGSMKRENLSFEFSLSHTHTHPGCRGTAAGLGQQATGSFILIVLRFQLDSSQPDLFTVWVSLEEWNKRGRTKIEHEERKEERNKLDTSVHESCVNK